MCVRKDCPGLQVVLPDDTGAIAGDVGRRMKHQALEMIARGRKLDRFPGAADVDLLRHCAVDTHVSDVGAVMHARDLSGERPVVRSGESHVDGGSVPLEDMHAPPVRLGQIVESEARVFEKLGAHDGVDDGLGIHPQDLPADGAREHRRVAREKDHFFGAHLGARSLAPLVRHSSSAFPPVFRGFHGPRVSARLSVLESGHDTSRAERSRELAIQGSTTVPKRDLVRLRAGRANPSLLEGLKVDYYGTPDAPRPDGSHQRT